MERTEKTANESIAKTTSNGPTIAPLELKSKLGNERMIAPAIPKKRANISLLFIFSLRKKAERMAMKTGLKDERSPAKPEEIVVSARLSDKWYMGTFSRAIANSLGRSLLSNFVFCLPMKGKMTRKTALAINHLSNARLTGESSVTALQIATNASPQKMLRTNRTPTLLTCCQRLPLSLLVCEFGGPT